MVDFEGIAVASHSLEVEEAVSGTMLRDGSAGSRLQRYGLAPLLDALQVRGPHGDGALTTCRCCLLA